MVVLTTVLRYRVHCDIVIIVSYGRDRLAHLDKIARSVIVILVGLSVAGNKKRYKLI